MIKKIASVLFFSILTLSATPAFAASGGGGGGGGSTSSPTLPVPTTTAGPCDLDNAHSNIVTTTDRGNEMDVELVNEKFPGGAVVHVIRDRVTNMVYVSNVCLDTGWKISKYKMAGAWGKDQGIDITVSYNGFDAVRYRLLGQGIRFDVF